MQDKLINLIELFKKRNNYPPSYLIMSYKDYYKLCKEVNITDQERPKWNDIWIFRSFDIPENYFFLQ